MEIKHQDMSEGRRVGEAKQSSSSNNVAGMGTLISAKK